VNEFVGHLEAEFMPWAGTNLSRAAGVHCVLLFNPTVYWPSGHFGQGCASGMVQDPSEFVASGSELFKEVPGSQQNIRSPGGRYPNFTTLGLCCFQLELHHTPCLKAVASLKKLIQSATLETSHFERSELKAMAFLNVSFIEVTLDTSHGERLELKALAL
jgi:hypothetical protein